MTDYNKLVEALRRCDMKQGCFNANCRYSVGKYFCDMDKVHKDAAAAVEELQAQLPKQGKWVRVEDGESYHYECSECGERPLYSRYGGVVFSGVCPMCGAKMEVQE